MREQTEPIQSDERMTPERLAPLPARRGEAGVRGLLPWVETSLRCPEDGWCDTTGRPSSVVRRRQKMTAEKTPIFVPVLDRFWILYQPLTKVGPFFRPPPVFHPEPDLTRNPMLERMEWRGDWMAKGLRRCGRLWRSFELQRLGARPVSASGLRSQVSGLVFCSISGSCWPYLAPVCHPPSVVRRVAPLAGIAATGSPVTLAASNFEILNLGHLWSRLVIFGHLGVLGAGCRAPASRGFTTRKTKIGKEKVKKR